MTDDFKVLPFPVLNEAAMKADDALPAAFTARIVAETSQPVLQYAIYKIISHIDQVTGELFEAYGIEEVKAEIAKSANRLVELCEALPNAPPDGGAGERLVIWNTRRINKPPPDDFSI